MAREDVAVVRSLFEAVARRDAAAVLDHYSDDVEWDDAGTPTGAVGGGRVLRGREEVRGWFREWYDAWDEVVYDVEELLDADPYVVSVVTMRGRGRASGLPAEKPQYAVWTVRGGRVARVQWLPTRREALERAGVRTDL